MNSPVSTSAVRLPWSQPPASSDGSQSPGPAEPTAPGTGTAAPSTSSVMTSIVDAALELVLTDPARAQQYISSTAGSPAADAATGAATASGASTGSAQTTTSTGSSQPNVAGATYRLPWGSTVTGSDLVQAQSTIGPYVGPAMRAAGAVIGGGPTSSTSNSAAATGTSQMSPAATAFVTTLVALDPAAISAAQLQQLSGLWQQIPTGERAQIRTELMTSVITPTAEKLSSQVNARAHPGTTSADQTGAQSALSGLAGIAQIIQS